MKKFKASELLTKEEMKKVIGSGYCSYAPCAVGGVMGECAPYLGGCRCQANGYLYGAYC